MFSHPKNSILVLPYTVFLSMKLFHLFFVCITVFCFTGCGNTYSINDIELHYEDEQYREYRLPTFETSSKNFEAYNEMIESFIDTQTSATMYDAPRYAAFEYMPSDTFNQAIPYLGGFVLDDVQYHLVEEGGTYTERKSEKGKAYWEAIDEKAKGDVYTIYKEDKKLFDVSDIFEETLCYGVTGFEGLFNYIQLIDDKLSFEFILGEDCFPLFTQAYIFFDGRVINDMYDVKEARHLVVQEDQEFFIGEQHEEEYLFLNGTAVSEAFDRIIERKYRFEALEGVFDWYSDGQFFFLGERSGAYYLAVLDTRYEEEIKIREKLTEGEIESEDTLFENDYFRIEEIPYTVRNLEGSITAITLDPSQWKASLAYDQSPKTVVDWQGGEQGIVINGGYFEEDFFPSGFLSIDGERIGDNMLSPSVSGLILVTNGNIAFRHLAEESLTEEELFDSALQSYPFLIYNGDGVIRSNDGKYARRTAIAENHEGNIVLLLADQSHLSLYEMMEVLEASEIDFVHVLNLDGGPSSGMSVHLDDVRFEENSFVVVSGVLKFVINE